MTTKRTIPTPEPEPIEESPTPEPTPPVEQPAFERLDTTLFERLDLPFCDTCGRLYERAWTGETICPVKLAGCERNAERIQ